MTEPVAWEHLKPFGYAPGNYTGHCHDCGKEWIDQDKHAWTCRACAEKNYAIAHPAPAPAEHTAADAPNREAGSSTNAESSAAGVPDVDGLRESFPEINPSNYGEQEVMALNQWGLEAYDALAALQSHNEKLRLMHEHSSKVVEQQAERITELKAKLAEAVGLLEDAVSNYTPDTSRGMSWRMKRSAFLAKAREVMG